MLTATTWCATSTTRVSPMLLVSALQSISGNATMRQCGMSDAKGMCAQEMERIIDASILGVSFGNEGRVV
jgi:hypothetical protein